MAPITERPELTNSTRVGEASVCPAVRKRSTTGKSMLDTGCRKSRGARFNLRHVMFGRETPSTRLQNPFQRSRCDKAGFSLVFTHWNALIYIYLYMCGSNPWAMVYKRSTLRTRV